MLINLKKLYPSAIVSKSRPAGTEPFQQYYWFRDGELWMGIPKRAASLEHLEVISSLYEQAEPEDPSLMGPRDQAWNLFLLSGGQPPISEERAFRIIQFQLDDGSGNLDEWKVGLTDFFNGMEAFIHLDRQYGIIIEEYGTTAYQEEDFRSISAALENDFYVKITFFIGKSRDSLYMLRDAFTYEREVFTHSLELLPAERVLTFEKAFPSLLASQLPETAGQLLEQNLVHFFREEPELLETMKVFLEHNSNVSLAAKKLYIHRNTMQYRLDRFAERSGINLKDYPSALAVYFACLKAAYQQ